MTVRVLQSDDEQVIKPFLSAHAETSMFLLSNLASAGIGNLDVPFGGAYWGIFDDRGTITGVAAHYANGNILMQAPDARKRHRASSKDQRRSDQTVQLDEHPV